MKDFPPKVQTLGQEQFDATWNDGVLSSLNDDFTVKARLAAMNSKGELMVVSGVSHCSRSVTGKLNLFVLLVEDNIVHLYSSPSSLATKTFLEAPPSTIFQISGGGGHFLLCTSSAVFSFGDNRHGQCGIPPSMPTSSSTLNKVEFFDGLSPTLVAAGGAHSVVVTADGSAYIWGDNREGQCGGFITTAGEPTLISLLPDEEVGDEPDIIDAACGSQHSVLVTRQKGVWVAGLSQCFSLSLAQTFSQKNASFHGTHETDHAGQLGLGDGSSRSEFTKCPQVNNDSAVRVVTARWTTFIQTIKLR